MIDFETTGLSSSDRVIEIGVAFLDEHLQIEKTWDALVNLELTNANSFVYKITDAGVAQALIFADIADTLGPLVAGPTVVAQNISFEQRFCDRNLRTSRCHVDREIDADEPRCLLFLIKTLPRFNSAPLQNYRDILCGAIANHETDDAEISCLHAAA